MLSRRAALLGGAALTALAEDSLPLFDGKSFAGWTLGDGGEVRHSWTIEEGAIATVAGTRSRSDLLCTTPVQSFELTFEFRLSPGSNTGIKYFVLHALRYLTPGSALAGSYGAVGLEFQLADDQATEVALPEQKLGSLYGLLPAQAAPEYRLGDWAAGKLVCSAEGCEHWINGKRVLAFQPSSPEMKRKLTEAAVNPQHSIVGAAAAMVAARRREGAMPPTLIALQQHDSKAWFRSLRLRKLA